MAARATLALKLGVWFRRGRLLIVSPDSLGTACPLSGRNSTYRPVQILEASSVSTAVEFPTGMGGKGNEGVAGFTARTKGAIGYVEHSYAIRSGLASVSLMNRED